MKRLILLLTFFSVIMSGCQSSAQTVLAPAPQTTQTSTVSTPSEAQHNAGQEVDATNEQQVTITGKWGTVTKVSDGDTLEVDHQKTRLIGVNAPETVKPGEPVFPYGKESSAFTKEQLLGKKVFFEVDVQATDKFGRTLAYVFLQEPKTQKDAENYMFNAILLREGYAQLMTIPPNVKYQEMFVRLQKESREASKGLWSLGIYLDEAKSSSNVFIEGKSPFDSITATKVEPKTSKEQKAEKQVTGCKILR